MNSTIPRKSTIALIWAQARDADLRPVIGAGGAIPWHVPEDFAYFKRLTAGHPVIMGERTWVSLPTKPLPGRTNIVLSQALTSQALTSQTLTSTGAVVAANLPEAFALAAQAPGGELTWVIGGASVYQQTLPFADRLYVTEIDRIVAGDTYAPTIDPAQFRESASSINEPQHWQTSTNGTRYQFRTYERA